MATKKKAAANADEKAAKRKARMEALKNRPIEQRSNSKQVDVIKLDNGDLVKTFAYPVKVKGRSIGCLVTTIGISEGKVISTSDTFIPGELVVKVKKGHGVITSQKAPKNASASEEDGDDDED